ncbi:LysR substrate-binding domain-containing protein [Methylocystis heyeri]|uniref:LysR family transcriptional regulator n=1 Tax=Methylocystis heyeri TaxID=391905 RepID=A0A6B8KBR1_9HYPH|nr:LysR substrate-binding domain-containing protein [Methylocystis heyeri]QGM45117.1 LysR family transcriptional regulator [Methylocystis heyeri]
MKNISLDARRLRYFVAVAEALNFRRAAETLNISQPPLSQQIQTLEAELGAALFIRHGRSIELTDAGWILLRRARALLASMEATATEIGMVGRGEMGMIRIGYMSAAMLGRLASILAMFRIEKPKVEVRLRQAQPRDQIAAVASGEIDVGLLSVSSALTGAVPDEPDLFIEPLWKEEMVLALPPGHRLVNQSCLSLHHLDGQTFLTLPRAPLPGAYEQLLHLRRGQGGSKATDIQEVEELPAGLALVAAGYGVGLVPVCVMENWSGEVIFRRLKERPEIQVAMLSRRNNCSPALSAFRTTVTHHNRSLHYRAEDLQ